MSVINPSPGFVLIKDINTNKIGDFELVSDEKERESMIGKVIKVGEAIKFERDEIDLSVFRFGLRELLVMGIGKKLKKDDIIIYPKYHSSSFNYEGEEYKMIQFEDIIGKIK